MDRSLDEILASQNRRNGGGRSRGGQGRGDQQRRREPRNDYPRDGVRKSYRDDAPRNIDTEWVHDRFEDNGHRARQGRRGQDREDRDYPVDDVEEVGTKIRVDNVHYDLTTEDLEGLFNGVGPVLNLDMKYDRAGRSTGSVFVTFEFFEDAQRAVKEFNGANAKGQPIHLKVLPPLRRREPGTGAGRPLSERATLPSSRNRSRSPVRDMEDEAARRNIDRYVPGGRRDRERSPIGGRGRERGRRPGSGRERGGRGNNEGGNNREGGERPGRNGRPRKTQEELDAEMEDYFNAQTANGSGGTAAVAAAAPAAAAPAAEEDIDMIE